MGFVNRSNSGERSFDISPPCTVHSKCNTKLFFDPTGLDTDHQKRIPTWLKVKGSIPTSGVLLLPFCLSLFPSSIHYIKEKHVILLQSNEAGLPS